MCADCLICAELRQTRPDSDLSLSLFSVRKSLTQLKFFPPRSLAVFRFWFSDFGSRFSGFGFRFSVFGFRFSVFGFRFSGFGFRISVFGFWVSGRVYAPPRHAPNGTPTRGSCRCGRIAALGTRGGNIFNCLKDVRTEKRLKLRPEYGLDWLMTYSQGGQGVCTASACPHRHAHRRKLSLWSSIIRSFVVLSTSVTRKDGWYPLFGVGCFEWSDTQSLCALNTSPPRNRCTGGSCRCDRL